ncbi:MAG: hypothetical protein K5679_02685 [Lachnospiraceae bacterium]|nr:hypothetical protein [Lachnospiraceae bacterium]
MKKALIALLALTIIAGSASTVAAATSCLDVRDYGSHRYAQQSNTYLLSSTVMGSDGHGNFVVYDDYLKVDICICGESRENRYTDVRYVPMW